MTLKYPLLQKYHLKKGYLKRNHDYFPVVQKENDTEIYFCKPIQKKLPIKKQISVRVEYFDEVLN